MKTMISTTNNQISQRSSYLTVEAIESSTQLARLLPRELASRFHALPVAMEGGQITVAMAHPEDASARDAITTILGDTTCVVQSSQETIDQLLEQLWSQMDYMALNISLCAPRGKPDRQVLSYARSLADLMGANLTIYDLHHGDREALHALEHRLSECKPDLLVWEDVPQSFSGRRLSTAKICLVTRRQSIPALIVRGHRWPVRKILLPLRGGSGDISSLDWVIRLACASGAQVTLLPLMPPLPMMYASTRHNLSNLLNSNSLLGRELRQISCKLVEEGIQGTLLLRQEPDEWCIHNETIEGDYDLVAIAGEPRKRLRRWSARELVGPLLEWIERPVLVARPAS
jgi:hypothetical protein